MSKAYEQITEQVIKIIEETGRIPWQRPWNPRQCLASANRGYHGHPYTDVNAFITWAIRRERKYVSKTWITFNQLRKSGGRFKKDAQGESLAKDMGIKVIGWFAKKRKSGMVDEETGEDIESLRFFPKAWTVWNMDLVEGVKEPVRGQPDESTVPHITAADQIWENWGDRPSLTHEGAHAFYAPSLDHIQLPPRGAFKDADGYYATLFHEAGHATGHASRLNRATLAKTQGFGSTEYSKEELIAEFCSAYLQGAAGIEATRENTAAYLQSWLKKLKDDPKMLPMAARQAKNAAAYILGE